ncbi:MAG: ATP-binding protein [Burkholderiaceae bacterium]
MSLTFLSPSFQFNQNQGLRHSGASSLIDSVQLDSALLNLAINARDAMPMGGALSFNANQYLLSPEQASQFELRPGAYVRLDVTDQGEGIPAEHLPRLFEPFFTTKETGRGTGLGLPMVYGFLRQSGGHVVISSRVGQGTTVSLYLPTAPDV